MPKAAPLLLTALLAAAPAAADQGQSQDDAAWKQQMQRKLDLMAQEIADMRLSGAASAPPAASTAPATGDTAAPATVLSPYSIGPAAAKIYGVEKGLSFGGYGEMIYSNFQHATKYSLNGDDNQNRTAEADLGRFVLYTGYRFSDKILFNSELEVESANSSKSGEVEAEFAYLDFALWKPLGFRVGELLLPVGLTNEYHEPTVYDSVLQPDIEQFLIPPEWHENGAGYYGQYAGFAYRGYVLAGLRAAKDSGMNQIGFQPDIALQEGQQEGSRSRAHDLAVAQRLDYAGLPGWIFGGSFYLTNAGQGDTTCTGGVTPCSGVQLSVPLTLWEGHLQGEWRGWKLRALYTQTTVGGVGEVNQANGLSGNQSVGQFMWGGYVELAYNVMNVVAPQSRQSVSPFFRYERYNTQGEVPAGYSSDPQNDRRVWTLGAAYRPIPRVVLKADYQIRASHAGGGVNQANMGMGFEF